MAHLIPNIIQQFRDANGAPLAGGKVYTYAAGTSTALATYVDQTEATPNTNPIILNANGEADIWIGSSAYKFVVRDSNDVFIKSVDNISHLSPGCITTTELANDSVTNAKMADNSVGTNEIINASVTNGKIADNAVTEAKIADSSVTVNKLGAGSVTKTKLASLGQQISASSGSFTNTTSTPQDVTNLSCTITTTGRPVRIVLIPDGSTFYNKIYSEGYGYLNCLRGATSLGQFNIRGPASPDLTLLPSTAFEWIDTPAAGTYTYKIQAYRDTLSGTNMNVWYAKLLVYEL